MKNKLLLSACAMALVAAFLTSCRSETDVMDLNAQIANNTMLGIYPYLEVDTATMATSIVEWTLVNDALGRNGSYRVATTGNGTNEDATTLLTWDKATINEDGLSMLVHTYLEDGRNVDLTWQDGVMHISGEAGYTTEKSLISMADVLRTTNDNFSNTEWEFNDTTNYITSRMDTTHYLAWKTAVVSYTLDQIDSAKAAMVLYHDTIVWFNTTYPNRAVPDTVRFSSKPQADGRFKGQVSVPYEDMEIKKIDTNHGPLNIINSEMVFNRDENLLNTGSFVYRVRTWTKEYYDDPTSPEAQHTDSIIDFDNMTWTPCSFSTIKKFNVLVKQNDEYLELPFSGFVKKDSVIVLNDHKFKLQ